MHPGITVNRDDIGTMIVRKEQGAPTDSDPTLRMFRVAEPGAIPATVLTVTVDPTPATADADKSPRTRIRIPMEGGIESASVQQEGPVSLEDILRIARQGTEIFDSLLHLPPDERRLFAFTPGGNNKAFDRYRAEPGSKVAAAITYMIGEGPNLTPTDMATTFDAFELCGKLFLLPDSH